MAFGREYASMCTIAINYALFTYGLSISRKRLSQLIFYTASNFYVMTSQ